MVMPLGSARADTCGGKAAVLAALLREGLPVPEGFVVPFATHRAAQADTRSLMPETLRDELAQHLAEMGAPPVAVRSSAAEEDTPGASAAGQYESVLGVRTAPAVAEAVRVCWASLSSARAADYWGRSDGDAVRSESGIAVLVQRMIDADVSGVMFTPSHPEASARIEASWGLGPSVVGGTVTPDTYEVSSAGGIRCTIGYKATRLDRNRDSTGLTAHEVPDQQRTSPALADAEATALAILGRRIAGILGHSQDIEWAIEDGQIWILQARPITASLPPMRVLNPAIGQASLTGTPGGRGVVTGIARVLGGPSDFARVQPGDIVICPFTDPAWTPLFRIAAAFVTETGGVLSHAAIVAREHGIPAVLGLPQATTRIHDGTVITVNGAEGTVTAAS